MNIAPFRIPTLEIGPDELRFWNALVSHSNRRIQLEAGLLSFSFGATQPSTISEPLYRVELPGNGCFFVNVVNFPFQEWLGVNLKIGEMRCLSPGLVDAINIGALNRARKWLPHALDTEISEILPVSPDETVFTDRTLQWLEVRLFEEADEPMICSIGIRTDLLLSLFGNGDIQLRRAWDGLAERIECVAYYCMGSVELDLVEVSRLSPGDLIVLDEKSGETVLFVTAGTRRYVFNLDEDQWSCSRITRRRFSGRCAPERKMDDSLEEDIEITKAVPADDLSPAASIPIIVDFDIGQLSVSVAQLESWQPGTVVELDPPKIHENLDVRIRANGKLLGHGDLVRIDNRIAVRVSQVRLAENEQEMTP